MPNCVLDVLGISSSERKLFSIEELATLAPEDHAAEQCDAAEHGSLYELVVLLRHGFKREQPTPADAFSGCWQASRCSSSLLQLTSSACRTSLHAHMLPFIT